MAQHNRRPSGRSMRFTERDVLNGAATKYRRKKFGASGVAVILCSVLIIAVLSASVWHLATTERPKTDKQDDIAESFIADNSTETEEVIHFESVTCPSSDVSTGDLILVNYEYKYVFPETEDHLVNIFKNKTDDYAVAYNNYVLDGDVLDVFSDLMADLKKAADECPILINSTYRSLEEQQSIYDSYVQSNGEEYASKYVADPGCSEHHTGLALDLTIRYLDGTYVLMKNYENLDLFSSLAIRHGFVQRYPENKYAFTHINTEPWHYRYVGIPHSYVMTKKNFCLEEYITFIADYTATGDMLCIDETGEITVCDVKNIPEKCILVYYTPVGDGAETEIRIAAGADRYTLSGDNCGGFVSAVFFGEFELPQVSYVTPGIVG